MKIVRRYLMREMMGLFLLSLAIITMLFMSQKIIQLTDWAINRGVGAYEVVSLMICLLPMLMTIIIPIVTLFSVLLAVGRLSSDHEIIALKASGVSLFRLLPPVLLFAAFAATLTMIVSQGLAPWSARATREIYYRITRTRTDAAVSERLFVRLPSANSLTVYAREKKPDGELIGMMMAAEAWPKNGDWILRHLAFAHSGRFIHDPATLTNELWLQNGILIQEDRRDDHASFVTFQTCRVRLDLEELTEGEPNDARELGPLGLRAAIARLRNQPPAREGKNRDLKVLANLRVLWHERLVFPLACLAIALWALPLGVQPPRSGRARAIIVSVILSGAFYYLMILGKFAALRGYLDPRLSIWTPPLLILLSGLYMLRQKSLERPILLVTRIEDWTYLAYDRLAAAIKKRREKRP